MSNHSKPATEPASIFEKRDELRRVLQSAHFANAPKKSRFLEFVADQTLLGNGEKLNELLIGMEVYDRGGDFNPQQDPIVRVQAHEIRRTLRIYYEEEGKTNPWRIDLPAGHYVPTFSKVTPSVETPQAAQGTRRSDVLSENRRWQYALILGLSRSVWV